MSTIGSKYRGTKEYQRVYCTLLGAAQGHDEVQYIDIAKILGIPTTGHHMAREVGQVLGEISEDEHKVGRPMLSAVAVSVKGFPGEGFFTLARRLGLLASGNPAEDIQFWIAEERRVYEEWRVKPVGTTAVTNSGAQPFVI